MQCVILAGGLATRLRPLTERIPKALIPINGRPFAAYQLAWLAREGVGDVVFCIGYLGEQLRAAIGDGRRFGLDVRYADEGKELKGTGGALRVALDAGLLADTFLVLYGDSYLPLSTSPVVAAFRASGRKALMTVMRNEHRWDTSNAIYDAPLVTLYDKHCDEATRRRMRYIDYGLSILSRALIADRISPAERIDLASLFKDLSLARELAGYEVGERFYEVGSESGIREFTQYATQTGL